MTLDLGTLAVWLIGLLMWLFVANPRGAEIGRLMFFAGMLAFLLTGAHGHLRIG